MNRELMERVVLRGIEGLISDKYLLELAKSDYTAALSDYYQAKQMAEQVFAHGRGWA